MGTWAVIMNVLPSPSANQHAGCWIFSKTEAHLLSPHIYVVDSLVERRTRDRKVAFRYLAGAAGEFLLKI